MALLVSKLAVISQKKIPWLESLDNDAYQIDYVSPVGDDFTLISENEYHLVMINDQNNEFKIVEVVSEIHRSQPLISTMVLSKNLDPQYELGLLEHGIDDLFNANEEDNYLIRRLQLAKKRNDNKRMIVRHNRNLNAVTVLSRQIHNAVNPNNLIIDTLEIVSDTFNLLGLVIVLENGSQFHLRAGNSTSIQKKRIYDVMTQLAPYNPIRQVIDKGIVMVFEDLSLNEHMTDLPIFDKLNSAIVVPLQYVNITLGAVMALGRESDPLTRDDIVIYEHIATHLGSAYQNARHSYTQDISAKTSQYHLRIWQQLSKVYTFAQVNEIILKLTSEVMTVKQTLIWMYDEFRSNPIIYSSNKQAEKVFQDLYDQGVIGEYLNQLDAQLHPLIIWLGRSNTRNIGQLFQVMEGQQLILVAIKDEARLLGFILVSSNSSEQMLSEYISQLEGIAHAAGQTLERNMLISYKDQQAERLEIITRSIKDGIFFVEGNYVVFCNPQLTEITGINPSIILNQPIEILIEALSNQSEKAIVVKQNLETALHYISDDVFDHEYPSVEVFIPSTDSHLYVEFIVSGFEGEDKNIASWIGVLRTNDHMVQSDAQLSYSIINSVNNHIQASNKNIYRNLVSFDNGAISNHQTKLLQEVKKYSNDIEQLAKNTQNLIRLNAIDKKKFIWNNPNQLLSIIVNKPPLIQYDDRLKIISSIKDKDEIYGERESILLILTNLIEVALQLSGEDAQITIQMSIQVNKFIFRVLSDRNVIVQDKINQILNLAYNSDIPFPLQLRLYSTNQAIIAHDGQLLIKSSETLGMQFNFMLPVNKDRMVDEDQDSSIINSVPDRKSSVIMIYDQIYQADDVEYDFLSTYNYEMIYCDRLDQVYKEVDLVRVDIIILTIRQSSASTLKFVEQLRQEKNITIPILILSTYNAEDIRIRSLKAGVDAYIGLPISNAELLAQIENMFERSKLPKRVHEPLTVGDLHIDFAQRQVTLEGKHLDLTRIEYELLCNLALKIGETVTHTDLLTLVWGPEYKGEKQYLWVNMSRLRRKLEKTKSKTRYIFTQPGVGYIMKNK